MPSDRIPRALSLFERIVELPAPERDALLAAEAGGDPSLMALVRGMLAEDDPPVAGNSAASALGAYQVVGAYVVEQLLGRGGMAEVWQVRHNLLQTPHALKVLTSTSAALQRRLMREGQVQARLIHPAILPVRDILDIGSRIALLMPLVLGPSLDALLRVYTPPEGEALALLTVIAEGLQCAHEQGYVHRDLKPANVLLELRHGDVRPRLADFGLVKQVGVLETRPGAVFGTPAYAAPEQLRDASTADHRADLFSFGVMMVELLTGRRPFIGNSIAQLLDAHRRPPELGELAGPLRALAAALLQSAPERRPASCAVVLEVLGSSPPNALGADSPIAAAARSIARPEPTPLEQIPATWSGDTFDHTPLPSNNLPRQRTPFFGRRTVMDSVASALEQYPLVTLLGTGGVGKTRLAIELGTERARDWPGGIWFIDLSGARERNDLFTATAQALGAQPGRDPEAAALAAIRGRGRALFVIDNFEQLAEHADGSVGAWMDGAPEARFLVTSRQPLRVRSERRFALDVLDEGDAIAMFTERARQVDPRFAVGPDNREAVTRLVLLLDCLPLAIELAASRVGVLSPDRMLARMHRRFDVLKTRSTDIPKRQRTMQATLRWSWELLAPPERSALAQCSVFEGGFTLEAAEAVLDVGDDWVIDVLAELLDRSLIVRRGERMTTLVSVRYFAASKLSEAGGVEATERRHGAHYAALCGALTQPGNVLSQKAREHIAEQQNFLAASRRAVARGDAETASLATLAAVAIGTHNRPLQESIALLEATRAVPGLAVHADLRLLAWQVNTLKLAGRSRDALPIARHYVELARVHGQPHELGGPFSMLALILEQLGQIDEALALYEQALSLFQADGNTYGVGMVHGSLARLKGARGEHGATAAHLREALRCAREVGNRNHEQSWLIHLGAHHRRTERYEEALEALEQALALDPDGVNALLRGQIRGQMGNVYSSLGRSEDAIEAWGAALQSARDVGDRFHTGIWLSNLSSEYRRLGRFDEGLPYAEEALVTFRGSSAPQAAFIRFQVGLYFLELGRLDDGDELVKQAESELRGGSHDALLLAALTSLARSERVAGRTSRGLQALERARAVADTLGVEPSDKRRQEIAALQHALEIGQELSQPLDGADAVGETESTDAHEEEDRA